MKFMKLGTRPDTFYTEGARRSLLSDVPSDLTIQVNSITYLLHQVMLIPKCGLLQPLCPDSKNASNMCLELHDIPGGGNAFELCAKFCYGITINLSAHNCVSALCAAKFLRMTETIDKGNFVTKLESFFTSCILKGWKDCILALRSTGTLPEWSENLGIIRRCTDSIVERILTPPANVTWSFTYTRIGYEKKHHQSVPRDWWTEDIADLDIHQFKSIIKTLKSTQILPPQLIGEALHVYACCWLPDTRKSWPPESSPSQVAESVERKQLILETIVSLIPAERGSVSIGFLLRLLSTEILLGVSPMTKTELVRRSGLQLEEATLNDLLLPSHSSTDKHHYDVDMVRAVLESFLRQRRRQHHGGGSQSVKSIRKVGKLIDLYLQVVARDLNMPVHKMVSLAEAVPQAARTDHDELYKAINIYLKEHPDLNKADRKQLCRVLDCQKLSPEVRAHAVRNDRLPLRTVVQVISFEQDSGVKARPHSILSAEFIRARKQLSVPQDDLSRLKLVPDDQCSTTGQRQIKTPGSSKGIHRLGKPDEKLQQAPESNGHGKVGAEPESEKQSEGQERGNSGTKPDPGKISQRRRLERSHSKIGRK